MPVSESYRQFVLEQLELCAGDIRAKRMFGAVGIYAGEYFFAVIDSDRLYFKVDDQTRTKYEAAGMGPARIDTEEGTVALSYWEVPVGVLEAPEELRSWVTDAIGVARRAVDKRRARRARRSRAEARRDLTRSRKD